MTLRVLGIGSWFAYGYVETLGQLRWGTRAERCNGGWVVVAVKRWSR